LTSVPQPEHLGSADGPGVNGATSESGLAWIDEVPPELQDLVVKLSRRPDFPEQLARTAHAIYNHRQEKNRVYQNLARRAWQLAPGDSRVRAAAEWALSRGIPRWHFAILRDAARNEIYERALKRFVTPHSTVLEIGAGSGILAMLAARAGAEHVYTCEAEPLLAEIAQENIERNGFGERVTVIAKHSTEVMPDKDIPQPADLFVSEIVDSSLLGEQVLPVVEDAKRRLLTPDALVLPSAVGLRGCLVGGRSWNERCRVGEVHGLDLSAMNRVAPPRLPAASAQHELDDELSDAVDVLRFDLARGSSFPSEENELTLTARRDGTAEGLLQWVFLGFGDGIELDTKPPVRSAWSPTLHAFDQPLDVKAGELIRLVVSHDRSSVTVSLA
jgi:type II protein arginine methyltransferase